MLEGDFADLQADANDAGDKYDAFLDYLASDSDAEETPRHDDLMTMIEESDASFDEARLPTDVEITWRWEVMHKGNAIGKIHQTGNLLHVQCFEHRRTGHRCRVSVSWDGAGGLQRLRHFEPVFALWLLHGASDSFAIHHERALRMQERFSRKQSHGAPASSSSTS